MNNRVSCTHWLLLLHLHNFLHLRKNHALFNVFLFIFYRLPEQRILLLKIMNINQTFCIHHPPSSITILAHYLENILPKLLFSFLKIFIVLKFLSKTQYLSLTLLDLCLKLLYLFLIGRMDHFCLLLPFNVGLTSILGYH